jgi:hypothetical protein
VSAQFGGLHFPQDIRAGGVLVTDFDCGRRHSINSLPEEKKQRFFLVFRNQFRFEKCKVKLYL